MLYEVDRLSRELDGLRQELAVAHRLATLGTLAAAAAHEVNNILTPIASYAQLALQEPDDARLTEKALNIAVQNSRRGARIFAATLGYTQGSEAGHGAQPAEAFAAALECLPRQPHQDGIKIEADFAPAVLGIHPTELQQVLLNLLLNARKALLAAAPPQARIRVQGRVVESGAGEFVGQVEASGVSLPVIEGDAAASHPEAAAGRYTLTITDNGPGIPARARTRLFNAFVTADHDDTAASQINASLSHPDEAIASRASPQAKPGASANTGPGISTAPGTGISTGTGLGLAVSRRLIEAAGGTIDLQDSPGPGAAFRITLPLQAS